MEGFTQGPEEHKMGIKGSSTVQLYFQDCKVPVENLLGEVPTCRGFSDYVSANREFACGTWDSTPYHRRQIPYRQVELMLLLEGKVTFSDEHGSVTFGVGDICLFIRGDGCAWLSEEYVKKVFATQRPVN